MTTTGPATMRLPRPVVANPVLNLIKKLTEADVRLVRIVVELDWQAKAPKTFRVFGPTTTNGVVAPFGPSVTVKALVAVPGLRVKLADVSEWATIDEIESPFAPGVEKRVVAVSVVQSEPRLPVAVTVWGNP